jgi:hypothetical protein
MLLSSPQRMVDSNVTFLPIPITAVRQRGNRVVERRLRDGLLAASLLVLGVSACSIPPRVPAVGSLAGQAVATTVDSEVAKYYLESYARGRRIDSGRDAVIDSALGEVRTDPTDREAMGRLTRRSSTDLATLYFVARLYEIPANRRAQDAFHAALQRLMSPASAPRIPEEYRAYLLAFVPGYAYRRDPWTGADFARPRHVMAAHGFSTVLIETDELGTVEENAAIVAREITRLGKHHDGVIVVSTSKGGPEVALALGTLLPADALGHVRAWISVGGLLRGSPYADRWVGWPQSWLARLAFAFEGLRPDAIENLSTAVRRPAFDRVKLPEHVLTLQYVGVPLSGHIGDAVASRYEALRPLGPNDGLTLLADELIPGGIVVTDVGLDHFYRDAAIDLKALALACVVLAELVGRQTAASGDSC